jgi:hypothetical protein
VERDPDVFAVRFLTDFITTYIAQQARPFTWRKDARFYQPLMDKLAVPARAAT